MNCSIETPPCSSTPCCGVSRVRHVQHRTERLLSMFWLMLQRVLPWRESLREMYKAGGTYTSESRKTTVHHALERIDMRIGHAQPPVEVADHRVDAPVSRILQLFKDMPSRGCRMPGMRPSRAWTFHPLARRCWITTLKPLLRPPGDRMNEVIGGI